MIIPRASEKDATSTGVIERALHPPEARSFSRVGEHQISLDLDTDPGSAPALFPELREGWSPFGDIRWANASRPASGLESVRLSPENANSFAPPITPGDRPKSQQLAIAGLVANSHEIDRWTIL